MILERTIAVVVLATGMMLRGVVVAASPPEVVATPEAAAVKPELQTRKLFGVAPWKQAELRPEHAVLARFVGHWTASVHLFEGPYVRLRDTEGTADGKLLMGGLFVQVTHAQKRMKQSFDGMMLYGFDEVVRKYTSDWIDDTSTAIIHYVGTYDAAKKQLNMSSHYSDQKSQRLTIARTLTTFVDEKTWTYDEYISHGVGEAEAQVVSITFKRP